MTIISTLVKVFVLVSLVLPIHGFPVTSYRLAPSSPTCNIKASFHWELYSSASASTDKNQTISKSNNKNDANKKPRKVTARYVAAQALMEAINKKGAEFPLRKLENDQLFNNLDARDRGFARLLVSTVERRKGQIDKVLGQCTTTTSYQKPKHPAKSLTQATLRIGVAQMLFLKTPSHAAVHETVEVLRMSPRINVNEGKIKFVNAILRRIDREGQDLLATTTPYDNFAPWLLKNLKDAYGEEKVNAIAEAVMTEYPVYLSINHPMGASAEEKLLKVEKIQSAFESHYKLVMEEEVGSTAAPKTDVLPHGSLFIDKRQFPGSVSSWPLYNEGEWWVQDASATLPAIALSNSCLRNIPEEGLPISSRMIVDMCAAPGGKTAQLLSLGFSRVTAVEFSARRARKLQSNLQRLNLEERCETIVADGKSWIPTGGKKSVDGVLLDVPCTATGTASRRPDVLRRDEDLSAILESQYKLATHCADNILSSGGVMVYATCSLLKEESEDQVHKLLSRNEGAKLKTIPFTKGEIPGFDDAIDGNGWLRVLPGCLPGKLQSCDGFFVARLQKG